jgi:hypothetical protein
MSFNNLHEYFCNDLECVCVLPREVLPCIKRQIAVSLLLSEDRPEWLLFHGLKIHEKHLDEVLAWAIARRMSSVKPAAKED